MFEKFFEGFQAKFIESFKALGEEKILVRILENKKASKEEYRTYFNCAWEFLQTTEIAAQQAKVEELEGKLKQAYEDVDTFATAHEALEKHVERDRSIIQFTQRANKDLIAERDELQKRVDAAIKCADLNFWNANTVKAMVEALKGEG